MDIDRDNVFERDGDMGDERLIGLDGNITRSMASFMKAPIDLRLAIWSFICNGNPSLTFYRKVEPDCMR